MKRKIVLFGISLLCVTNIFAKDCKISSSPAKSIDDIRGTDTVALSISHIYYDKNKKMQLKSYKDAYIDFYTQAENYIKDNCQKANITKVYNFNVNSIIDKNYYHFNATWDFN